MLLGFQKTILTWNWLSGVGNRKTYMLAALPPLYHNPTISLEVAVYNRNSHS